MLTPVIMGAHIILSSPCILTMLFSIEANKWLSDGSVCHLGCSCSTDLVHSPQKLNAMLFGNKTRSEKETYFTFYLILS